MFPGPSLPPTRRRFSVPQPASLKRTRPEKALSETSRALVDVIAVFGILPTRLAIAVARTITRKSATAHYASLQALQRVGIIQKISFKELQAARAPGLGQLVLPGPQWGRAFDADAAPHPLVTSANPTLQLIEQLVLGGDVIRRAALGGTVLRGDAWFAGAVSWESPEILSDRRERLARRQAAGPLHFPEEFSPVGVIPPPGVKGAVPTLMIGGAWSRVTELGALLPAVGRVAPVELCMLRRGEGAVEQVRRRMAKTFVGQEYSPLTLLPRSRGAVWSAFWRRLFDTMDVAVERDLAENETGERSLGRRLIDAIGAPGST
jgi:hypothetical protein